MKLFIFIAAVIAILALIYEGTSHFMGAGAFKRMTTIGGVYAVCKPNGYPFICFLDADSKDGGLSCVPFVGECKR